MAVVRSLTDLDAKRKTDFPRWGSALAARWWIAAAGLLAGAVGGAVFSLTGGSLYQASLLVAPGDVFSPSGAPVLNYVTSPRGISDLITSESTLRAAADKAQIGVDQLRGHVSTESLQTGAGAVAARGTALVKITVRLSHAQKAADAANALGAIVVKETTSGYVKQSLGVIQTEIAGYKAQLNSLTSLVKQQNAALAKRGLDPLTKLILVSEVENAALRQATISNNLNLAQQELALAQGVELTQVLGPPARAVKTTGVSHRNAVLVGALIGLLLGGIAAIFSHNRLLRPRLA